MPASGVRLPQFVLDVVEDPRKRGILISGSLGVFAAGLVPRTLSPGLPDVQSALRAEPELQSLLVLMAFLASAAVIAGGVVSDIWRRRSVLLGGLAAVIAATSVNVLVSEGLLHAAAQAVAVIASGVVLTYAIGSVALAYEGVPRATALGVVYGAYGAATATAPPLLLLFGVFGPRWQAYLACALAALLALWGARRWTPELPGRLPAPRSTVLAVGLWGIAILAIVTGLLAIGRPGDFLIKVGLAGGGLLVLAGLALRRRKDASSLRSVHVERRAMAAALGVGVIVGFIQSVPLLLLPGVFQYVLVPAYQPAIWATVAIAPFAIALFVAGPVSGILLSRYSPRMVIFAGTAILAVGNVLLALALGAFGRGTTYGWLILPLAAIGAGFVISTTVRTAIVFAATPRGLPASAAGYNEASVGLGARVGTIASILYVSAVAVGSLRSGLAGAPDLEGSVAEFERILVALGTPGFGDLVGAAAVADRAAYATAYLDGVVAAVLLSGVIGLIGAVVAAVLVGPRDPLRTVFDLHDERHRSEAGPEPTAA